MVANWKIRIEAAFGKKYNRMSQTQYPSEFRRLKITHENLFSF